MKKFFVRLGVLSALAVIAFLAVENYRLRQQVRTLRETLRLLERERTPVEAPPPPDLATQAQRLARLEQQTSALRQLPFHQPVRYKTIGRSQLRDYLQQKLHEQFSPVELRDYGRSLETVGLIPTGTDLAAVILGLYDEQVAAFYVPEERALYRFADADLSSPLGQVTLAHELTHALQDQNFDLLKLPLRVKDNEDRARAAAALVEGDATVLMTQFYGEHLHSGDMLGDMLGAVLGQRTAQFHAAPVYLRDMMLFPYQEGARFANALYAAGGWDALNAAYRQPPVSTEEILHPEKFLGPRELPETVELPATQRDGWRPIGENTLGEFGIRSLFSQHLGVFEAIRAAQGWNGDRYRVQERSADGATVLLWASAWDSPEEAEEFAAAYRRLAQKRQVSVDLELTGHRVMIRQAPNAATLELWR